MSASAPPSPPTDVDLKALVSLINVLENPEAAKALILEMGSARLAWEQERAKAMDKLRELDAKKAEHDAAIEREREEHEAKLDSDRRKFDKLCNQGMAEVSQKKTEADQLLKQARADSAAAAKLKADYERRLGFLRQAGAV
jgi:hypothetical protein